ncbi:Transcription initiation factor IIA subunit 2 [Penicillium psychrosexuale]|uniref:Transcription initiation factor IIA subunit 2 n=1 Tax=Penicillium psychrosexuale TaxID=1002107 RepID=UPI00254527A4|nr:Transcription initiation factor IIA subunit 2 [Penicillium psychrosexuale]KAJ5800170.1 Transcription initiation factor IIA subunit 2 [Penicillium psychrosexuale]
MATARRDSAGDHELAPVNHSPDTLSTSLPLFYLRMASVAYYELYRGSSLGLSLTDTLDDLINEGRIEPQLAMKILGTFDKIVTEVLADKVRARLTFKGHLDTYRFCDEVWTFLIKDVSFKLDNQTTVSADKVKIVSCNSKRPGEV